ncbi:hypothetical protein [Vulcanisaeta sp. JCM 14467]|uniref:hypothetical protein n=1 Tax=Vulcanisaeta sp. JCM 14467 TaxID=1295370 RepID=UPI0006D02AA7|nr:hypothetical protein [Vulcanisaeta sp. JCM 14467]
MGRLVILNALPLNAFGAGEFMLRVRRVGFGELPALAGAHGSVIHYVRHRATVSLLSKYLPLNPSLNPDKYEVGDTLLVVVLKSPQRGQEVDTLTEGDVELFLVSLV